MDRGPDAALACEVLVVGAGLAGLVAAIGFARAGFDVVLCGAPESPGAGRTVALFDSSVRLLQALGAWAGVEAEAAPLRGLRIIDDTGSLFSPPPTEFDASEIGLDAFGWNIENARLVQLLAGVASGAPGLRMIASRVAGYEFGAGQAVARCADGSAITAKLVAAADGRASPARKAAGIHCAVRPYPQSALTAITAHSRDHGDFSTEFHTREGPFTLVPLPESAAGPKRSSLVWMMGEREAHRRLALDEAALAEEIERRCRSMLGKMRLDSPRGLFPIVSQSAARMTADRLALIGDAAHVIPPIGAQGLNLGLRDGAHLIEAASRAREEARDIGGPQTLVHYESLQRVDVAFRAAAVNGLNRSLLMGLPPVDFARGVGLVSLGAIGPLRRLVMREGVAPHFSTPRTMRAPQPPTKGLQ